VFTVSVGELFSAYSNLATAFLSLFANKQEVVEFSSHAAWHFGVLTFCIQYRVEQLQ
jgi:hypothetical protein